MPFCIHDMYNKKLLWSSLHRRGSGGGVGFSDCALSGSTMVLDYYNFVQCDVCGKLVYPKHHGKKGRGDWCEGKHVAQAAKVQFTGPKARKCEQGHICIECAFLPAVRGGSWLNPNLNDVLASTEGLSGCCDLCKTWAATYVEEKMPKLLAILDGSDIDSSGFSGCSLDEAATSGTSSRTSSGTSRSTSGVARRWQTPPPPTAPTVAPPPPPPPPGLEAERIKAEHEQLRAQVHTIKTDHDALRRNQEELQSEITEYVGQFAEHRGELKEQHDGFKADIQADHGEFKVGIQAQHEEFKVLLGCTVRCQQEEIKGDLKMQYEEFKKKIKGEHDEFKEQNQAVISKVLKEHEELKADHEQLKQEHDGVKAKHKELHFEQFAPDDIATDNERLKAASAELKTTNEGLQKGLYDMKRRVAAQYKKRPPTWGSIELYKDKDDSEPATHFDIGSQSSGSSVKKEQEADDFEDLELFARATEQSK